MEAVFPTFFVFAVFKIVATVSLLCQCPSARTLTSVMLTPEVSTLPSTRTLSIVHNADTTVRSNLSANIKTNRADRNAVYTKPSAGLSSMRKCRAEC